MIIELYDYIVKPKITYDIITDLSQYLISNNKLNTYKHVKEVEEYINVIGKKYNLDFDILKIATYAHDIANIMNSSDMLEYIVSNNLYLDEAEKKYPFLLHQRFSKMILEDVFRMGNSTVLSMVECHTTLKGNASAYDLALFIADKLSWDQEGQPPYFDAVMRALDVSLEKAALVYIDYIFEHEMVLYPHSWLLAARKYLKESL